MKQTLAFLALGLSLAVPLAASAQVDTPATRSAQLHKLFENYWQDQLKNSPETATSVGDKRYNDRWSDYTGAAVNAWLARERDYLNRLATFDTTGLAAQDKISVDLLVRNLIDDQEGARFKEWQMPVNQFNGPQTGLPQVVDVMPFDDVHDYDNLIARLKGIPTVFAQVEESMSLGADAKRTPPRFVMEQVVKQVDAISNAKPEDTPFLAPLKHFPAGISAEDRKRITKEATDAWTQQVQPAYARFGKFLTAQYIPACRTEPGASALPDGDAYYAFRVRQSTTLKLTPAQIHQIGLDEVKRDETEMLAIAKKLGFTDLKSFNASIKTNPKLHATSADQLLGVYKGYIAGMQAKLPQLFGTLPKAPLEVVKVPDYMAAQQSQAYYDEGTPDGKRPGRVFVNTYHFADRGLENAEAVSYHEGVPGHHLQLSIAQEVQGLPEFRKHSYYTAYTEGWGLYSERLGKDVGFYQDPYSDYGRLEADIWRAIRLVVDTGVHSQHWTRQQMVDFFHDHSGIDETNIQSETDRYIAWPAQALGYKMGQLKFIELRERARTKLGPKFKLSDYHDLVIDSGALPMDLLEQRVDAWIAAGGGKPQN
ncbi:DUF885 domain-containing protein [Terriglobus aquaticus]|uniref:DUF885 domain-containing protein n=1 Tax=Terriglobus aquaticus TaxID=940139 RepID=A0ABW9KIJ3_9BACT|nr:DUF885 domain-containing protein [Terriglobus aquaticus]